MNDLSGNSCGLNHTFTLMVCINEKWIYLIHRDVFLQHKYIEYSRPCVWGSDEQQDLTVHWQCDVEKPLNNIPDQTKGR